MRHISLYVSPLDKVALTAAGLITFEDFMNKATGSMISAVTSAQVIRMELPTANAAVVCFLKRTLRQKPGKNLRFLLHGRIPHTNAYREMQNLFNLQKYDVPTMRVMAGGEERRFGLPVRGFILAESVPGKPLHDTFLASDAVERRELIAAYAAFVARLHTLGFFQTVRLKDLIWSHPSETANNDRSLTLIDRVAANPGRKPFWSLFCIQSLRRGFRRMIDDGIVFNPSDQKVFADSYARNVAARWKITATEIEARLARR